MVKSVLILISLFALNLKAQQIIKVYDVVGRYILSNDITPKQAKEFALLEAKKNALLKAGVSEFVVSNVFYIQSESNNKISDKFKKFMSSEVSGAVSKIYDNVTTESKDIYGNTIYEVKITADVVKYETTYDPTFNFSVQGIDKVYKVNDRVTFTCNSYSDGYLHIFQINDTFASKFFPNVYEKDYTIVKNTKIRFPRLNGLAYSLDQKEENNLIFVFTKKNIPFNNPETADGIFEWIYKIRPDERQIQIFNVIVK